MWKDLTDNVNTLAAQPDDAGAQHRAGHDRGRERRPDEEDHRRRQGRDARAQGHDQRDGRPALARSPTRSRASRARSAPRARSAARRSVEGVSGTWRALTDSVNSMALNLTDQVRNIAEVTTAVANGDLSKKITVEAKGEVARARRTRSTRWSTSSPSFADEVTRVAREVGTEGRLGGQAEVEGRQRARGATSPTIVNLHGVEPHRPGAQHRRRHDRGREGRPVAEDHRRRARRDPRAEEHDQHDGRPARRRSPTRSRASRARSAPRACSAARPRSKASRACGATSPRT